MQAVSSFLVGFIIAFYFSWKLTLVIMSFLPLLITGGAIKARILAGGTVRVFRQNFALEDPMAFLSGVHCSYRYHHELCLNVEGTAAEQKQYADAGGVAAEVLTLFRSVVAFGTEAKELARYCTSLDSAQAAGNRTAKLSGIGLGYTYFVMYGARFDYNILHSRSAGGIHGVVAVETQPRVRSNRMHRGRSFPYRSP